MKKLLILLVALSGNMLLAQAQDITSSKEDVIHEGMSYSDYKDLYDTSEYQYASDDRYGPALAGITSFLIPGLGQCISGEIGRGICFFGAELVGTVLFYTAMRNPSVYDHPIGNTGEDGASALALGALAGMAIIDIWSIIDAVHVAKIKNMYLRDMRGLKSSIGLEVEPYIAYNSLHANPNYQPATGVSIKLRF